MRGGLFFCLPLDEMAGHNAVKEQGAGFSE
jgi:hypothetical protein